MNGNKSYDDIIGLPHHVSTKHKSMSVYDRAAQFASFMALAGYEDATKETARLTEQKMELDENAKQILDNKISFLINADDRKPKLIIKHFIKDNKKAGGQYVVTTGFLKKIDETERLLILENGQVIKLDDIVDIDVKTAQT